MILYNNILTLTLYEQIQVQKSYRNRIKKNPYIKTYGNAQKATGMWHFIGNKESNSENLTLLKNPMADSENALNAYENIVKTFKNKNFVGKIIQFKIMMLKMLFHLFGDIHMPDHTGSYYNSTIVSPKNKFWGDQGGNRQNINFYTNMNKKEKTNIHYNLNLLTFTIIGKADYKDFQMILSNLTSKHSLIEQLLNILKNILISTIHVRN
ncbi:hypothetical protein ABPG72_020141 [Tetrahymena utriculariae]